MVSPKGGGKPFVQTYSDRKTVEWEEHVANTIREQVREIDVQGVGLDLALPFAERILLSLRFNMHRPVSYPASVIHHLKRPDVDNLAKAVMDGLQNSRIIVEDSQITDLSIIKRYESDGHPLGVEIDLTALPDK